MLNFNNIKLFIILVLLAHVFSYDNITLSSSGNYSDTINSSKIYKVTGEVNTTLKFLVISIKATDENKKLPFLFVSKIEHFNFSTDQYDYSFTSYALANAKLIIPTNYFNFSNSKGFYLNITVNDDEEINLSIYFSDIINVELNEIVSFHSKSGNLSVSSVDFKINDQISNKEDKTIVSILSGGNNKQLTMKADGKHATEYLPNVLVTKNSSSINVIINQENIKFTFFSYLYDESKQSRQTVYEDKYDQYFFIKSNEIETLDVISLNNDGKRNLIITGRSGLNITVTLANGDEINRSYFASNNEKYVSTENILCNGKINNIIINNENNDKNIIIKIYIKTESVKIYEPLINDIDQNINLAQNEINLHTHENVFIEESYHGALGIDMNIEVLSGEISVYKYICNTYPFCNITEDELKIKIKNETENEDFETLYPINRYISYTIYPDNSTNYMTNRRNVFIVLCEEGIINNNENNSNCTYKINFHDMMTPKELYNNSNLMKYLPYWNKKKIYKSEDKYLVYLHKNNLITVELLVYSGDAFFIAKNDKNNCTVEKNHHYGSNQRLKIFCENDIIKNKIKFEFQIQANADGAFYQIYVRENEKNSSYVQFPIGATFMESFHEDKQILILNGIINKKNYNKQYTVFNPLNCDLNIINLKDKNNVSTIDDDVTVDINKIEENNENPIFEYNLTKLNTVHIDERSCLCFISSNYLNNDLKSTSYLILPEAKPFRIRLNKDSKIIPVLFPYASTNSSNKIKPKIYLKITMIAPSRVKLNIQVGYGEIKNYTLFNSKNIPIIFDDNSLKGLRFNKMTPIKLIFEYEGNEEDEAILDLNIKTLSKIPYSVKAEEHFSDVAIYNGIQYYLTALLANSTGNILINFEYGSGKVYGRLISTDEKKEKIGWNNRFILPKKENSNIFYDSYEQKLSFDKNITKNCKYYCYLIFGVEGDEENGINMGGVSYSLYLRYFNNKEEDEINFVNMQDDVFIIGSVTNTQNDYYKYKIQTNITKLLIYFRSDFCKLTYVFNPEKINNANNYTVYESQGQNTIITITREEILRYYEKNSTDNFTIFIKIEPNYKNCTNLDLKYKFRINSVISKFENITKVDTSQPIYCKPVTNNDENYCDFLVELEKLQNINQIEFVSISSGAMLEMYANISVSNNFEESPEWPTKEKYQFSPKNLISGKILIIKTENISSNFDNSNFTKILIRVYSNKNYFIELYTNIRNGQKYHIPYPKYYNFLSANSENETYINIPNDYSYSVHIISIEGEGEVFSENNKDKIYKLFGDYDTIVLNIEKNKPSKICIKANKYNENNNNYFGYFIHYSKINQNEYLEKLSVDSAYKYAFREKQLPLIFYFKISTIKENIPFNLYFHEMQNLDEKTEGRDINITELFNFKGYLLNEEKMIYMQQNNEPSKILSSMENYTNNITGFYDIAHHQGNVIFPEKNIKQLKNNNTNSNIYGLVVVDKNSINEKNYEYITCKINTFSSNDTNRSVPSDTFITDKFETNENNNTLRRIYKLDGSKAKEVNDINMYIEFSTTGPKVNISIIKNPENSDNASSYFDISKIKNQSDIGKDIYILKKNFSTVYLLVEYFNNVTYNIDYTFRYYLAKDLLFNYIYNNIMITKYIDEKLKITFDKIIIFNKTHNISSNCNYYIRIFKEEKEFKDNFKLSTSYRSTNAFAVYKIDHNDKILTNKEVNIELPINFTDNGKYDIDILAEILNGGDTYEFLSYSKSRINLSIDKNYIYLYVIIGICCFFVLLLIFLIIVCYICKKRNKDLIEELTTVSFKISNVTEIEDNDEFNQFVILNK